MAFEPNQDSFIKLSNFIKKLPNSRAVQKGAWHEKATLCFSANQNGVGSKIEADTNAVEQDKQYKIEVEAIDNLVNPQEYVGFIKMDIEGSEMNALKGARKSIARCRPILAVCVYHKRGDLITIPQYIASIASDTYKFYLRHHSLGAGELVLYAIPCP